MTAHKKAKVQKHSTETVTDAEAPRHHKATTSEAEAPQHPEPEKQKEIRITLPELKGLNLAAITTVLAVVLLATIAFQASQAYSISKKAGMTAAEQMERNRPAAIQATSISADCSECSSADSIIKIVETAKVNITKKTALAAKDAESQQLIQKHGIKRLPTVIVTGEIDKANLAGFAKSEGAMVYQQAPPPYFDVADERIKGLVSITLVNASSCRECADMAPLISQLKKQATVTDFKVFDKDSQEGKKIIDEYEMERLPGILVSNEIMEYPAGPQLAATGTAKKGGTIALSANPPYLNTSTGKVEGLTTLILLNDTSCAECYDVSMHISIVKNRFGVYTESIKTVDVASTEGKEMASKYGINAVPTILITGDAQAYTALAAIWPSVGTVEKDGTHVFRQMSQIAGSPYKNLTTGEIERNTP